MEPIVIKSKRQGAPGEVRSQYFAQFIGGNVSSPASRSPVNGMKPGAPGREAPGLSSDAFRLTAKETESFMHIVEATSKITRHYELFRLLQSEVQFFIPHQILISAWGDFRGSKPKLDVISAIQGVRTRQLDGCGIEPLLKGIFTRWVAGGRRPMLLENAAAEAITSSTCDCAVNVAMRRMRSVLVHGIHSQRDDLDSLYVALNPVSVKNGQSTERFFFLVDSLVAQLDVAFRKVAALKSGGTTAGQDASRRAASLSAREQEIVKWITEGKTNAEIAEILGISSFTVKNHAQRIFRKLDVTNRTEAVAKYRQETLPAL
jgi:transcriptional regulator EpsA